MKKNKKAYSAPAVCVVPVEIITPLALSGGEQNNMGTHTDEDIDAGGALAPGLFGRPNWFNNGF